MSTTNRVKRGTPLTLTKEHPCFRVYFGELTELELFTHNKTNDNKNKTRQNKTNYFENKKKKLTNCTYLFW